jgi:hypothetical protein
MRPLDVPEMLIAALLAAAALWAVYNWTHRNVGAPKPK